MGDFEKKHYTNPSLMFAALRSVGVSWSETRQWPARGLVRVQWEGPWMAAGVPLRARYRHTHWIGAATLSGNRGVFDINCMNNGSGWVSFADWEAVIVPHLTASVKRANGEWSVTHAVEVGGAA
jgi:hypothetical protein